MPMISIRVKLVLLSVAMLSIPYVGFQYLRETERYLQSSLEDSLLAVAGALAVSLQNQSTLFRSSFGEHAASDSLFVHALSYPIHVDGYTDDWNGYMEWFDRFEGVGSTIDSGDVGASFDLVVGEHGQYLYLVVSVSDQNRIYQRAGSFAPENADTVELVLRGENEAPRRVYLGTAGPGPVTAYTIVENWDFSTARHPVTNIVGEWRETEDGYVVEIRVPLILVGSEIGVAVHDRDVGSDHSSVSTGDAQNATANNLLRTSALLQQMIERVGLKKGRRVWVINRGGQVLASGGTLASEVKRGAINFLYTWILPAANESFEDDLKSASRLRGEEVLRALTGQSSTRWRSSPDERAVIVSAAHPVRAGNELIGAIVVEETTNSIQTLQRDAMAALFNKSIAVFIGISFVLLIYASRLSYRIAKLRDQAESAIDPHGRVVGLISGSSASDEIGDLSRSYSEILQRLTDYNAYLESMASKLSHELRTPLAVVSSSLENLDDLKLHHDQERYLERAREGMQRLHNLVSRLSEASRLEQSVSNVEFEEFDLAELIEGCVDGYRQAYPHQRFDVSRPPEICPFVGSGDLIAQLLDKLVDNAIAFRRPDTPIEVSLLDRPDRFELCVTNQGEFLPEAMQKQIFNSMVSLRSDRADGEPHLGLGLFIARLIAKIHHKRISTENLEDGAGVVFRILLPRSGLPALSR